jgi:hypothetical protein
LAGRQQLADKSFGGFKPSKRFVVVVKQLGITATPAFNEELGQVRVGAFWRQRQICRRGWGNIRALNLRHHKLHQGALQLKHQFGIFAGQQNTIRLKAWQETDLKAFDFVQRFTRLLSRDEFLAPKRFRGGNVDGVHSGQGNRLDFRASSPHFTDLFSSPPVHTGAFSDGSCLRKH